MVLVSSERMKPRIVFAITWTGFVLTRVPSAKPEISARVDATGARSTFKADIRERVLLEMLYDLVVDFT